MSGFTKGVHHVGLSVRDLARSKQFYTELLGFELLRENPGVSAFVSDGTTMITLWQTAETEATVAAAGLHHLAFATDCLEKVQELESRLKKGGIQIQYDSLGVYGRENDLIGLFFYDPDGIRLEVNVDVQGDEAGGLPTIGGCAGHA